ncbi:hypothetical protein GA0061098_10212 [Bradyrhizobium shewense]|uniref:Uncharacterized protein n=1 Tax=Bradyrhizobium shewense TaxID=1761772 RepID=A0A1C3XNS0_9BRAD|nr:hypothetical protein GA0061098_10212 [Bradyrhizobium shewense]
MVNGGLVVRGCDHANEIAAVLHNIGVVPANAGTHNPREQFDED